MRLADLVYYFVPIRKKVVLSNLTAAFAGSKTPSEIKKIAHGVYTQFAQSMVELLFFPKIGRRELERLVKFENLNILEAPFKNGKGAILVGSHFCNWELWQQVSRFIIRLRLWSANKKTLLSTTF